METDQDIIKSVFNRDEGKRCLLEMIDRYSATEDPTSPEVCAFNNGKNVMLIQLIKDIYGR